MTDHIPASDENNECGDCLHQVSIVLVDGRPALMDAHAHCDLQAGHGGFFHEAMFVDESDTDLVNATRLQWER